MTYAGGVNNGLPCLDSNQTYERETSRWRHNEVMKTRTRGRYENIKINDGVHNGECEI